MLAGWVGGMVVGLVLAGGKRVKREPDDKSNSRPSSPSGDAPPDDVEAAAGPPRRKSKQAVKKDGDDNPDDTPLPKHKCRFCPMKFDKSQALGGHMNRHRQERENEELKKAKALVIFREQHFGGPLWNMQGGPGPGTLHQGGNMLPNTPLVGASSRPYFPPNQQTHQPLQNWQFNQLLSTQQTSYSLQSQSQGPGGSFYSSQDNTRPQAQGGHQQLRVNPGQHQMAQGQVQQPGADFGSHGQGSFQMEQVGPMPLEEGILGSNPNNAMSSFLLRNSQGNVQFMDPFGASRLPPLNETHFQHTFQDANQHNYLCDQRPGSSTMGGLDANQVHGGGILHMPSFQDSTDHIQDDYQDGGNDGHIDAGQAAGAGLEGSPDDVSNDAKIPR